MPIVVPTRRSFSSVDGDEEDEHVYTSNTPATQPSSGPSPQTKRQRVEVNRTHADHDRDSEDSAAGTPRPFTEYNATPSDVDGDRSGVTADSWNLSPPATIRRPRAERANHGRAPAAALARHVQTPPREHKTGSIVRVTLKNFVTYTSATFHPGPALNMVIGPNGTGKSTLVCAICLGLGWGPKHLGRAKEPGEFVKHGHTEAEIEIELKGFPGKRNSVIRRNIRREGNKSTYHINGESSNATNVLALARKYGIQVDNLCHFLPQDRVVEFAGLTPVDRLTQTLRAAAPEQMIEWHDELKKLRVDQRVAEQSQASVKQSLTNLEGRQNAQRADVERIREREELVETVSKLEKLRPMADYYASKAQLSLAKGQQQITRAQLAHLQHESEPTLAAVHAKKEYTEQIEKAIKSKKAVVDGTRRSAEAMMTKKQGLEDDIQNCKSERNARANHEKTRKKETNTAETAIRDLQRLMAEPTILFDAAAHNERGRDKDRQIMEIMERQSDVKRGISERSGIIEDKKSRIVEATAQLQALHSQAGQQMSRLKNVSEHTFKAWQWLQGNQHQFKSTVYGPPLLECQVKDKRRVQQIENTMNKSEFLAITCTNEDDFKLLTRTLYNQMKLSDVYLRNTNGAMLEQYRPPVSDGEQSLLGLEGWAIDFISGPAPVLTMLCGEARLHLTGIMGGTCTDAQSAALEMSPVNRWIDSKKFNEIRRRREYAEFSSTSVRSLRPAQWWTEEAVDTRMESDIKDNIAGWTSEVVELKKENERDQNKTKELGNQKTSLTEEKAVLDKEKAEKQKTIAEQLSRPQKLTLLQANLASLKKREVTFYAELTEWHEKETNFLLKRAQLAIDYSKVVERMRTEHVQLVTASLYQIEAASDLEQLEERHAAVRRELEVKEAEVQEIDSECRTLREQAKKYARIMNTAVAADPNLGQYYEDLSEQEKSRTPEELNDEIESQCTRLELLHQGDPRTVREYDQRAKEIERLQREVGDNEDTLTSLEQSISSIRAQWEPSLEKLVEKISNAFAAFFEKLKCAGGVQVHKGDNDGKDFENWAINIMVKFREGEDLSQLDSHRQSGGERAVSTICYLMALQSLSRAPFRVVDEINQGMDPRNERMVHEMMVDVACGTAADQEDQGSQYFLITPKLLTDLKYKPGMKVHCIASGEYMPENHKELDFSKLLQKAKQSLGLSNGLVAAVGA